MPSEKLKKEITLRTKKFQESLQEQKIDGGILVQKADIYYLTGTDQESHLWVPASGDPLLMVKKSLERSKLDSPLENIVPLSGYSQLPHLIEQHSGAGQNKIGLEMDILPVNFYQVYRKLFPSAELIDISPLIRSLRMVKSPHEISLIKAAANIGDDLFTEIPLYLESAGTEIELAIKAEAFYRGKGHPGIVRMRGFNAEIVYGHIMAGKSSASASNSPGPTGGKGVGPFYSQGPANEPIEAHSPILVDYTSNAYGYLSDQARIFSRGVLDEKFYSSHNVMLEVHELLCQKARPGIMAGDLYALALEIVKKAHLEEGFMGYPDPVSFVGHGVGLELDEWPVIGQDNRTILESGMVFALEPKYVFPGQGVVGIENTVVVTEHGLKSLNLFPYEIVTC